MKFKSFFYNLLKNLFGLFLVLIILQFNSVTTYSLPMNTINKTITEELRLNIPFKYKNTWIKAEKEIWEPWLAKQDGFIERKIFYDQKNEIALLLVNWESKELWKNISIEEVNKVQNIFEDRIKNSLELEKYPFDLVFEGELVEQK